MKRLTALLLFVMLTVLPLAALAEPATLNAASVPSISAPQQPLTMPTLTVPYVAGRAASVKIWGRTLDSATPYYKNGNNGAQGTVSSDASAAWNAYYNASTGVLKLNGLTVTNSTATTDTTGNFVYGVYAEGGVTIELSSNSSVSAAGSGNGSSAIYVTGDLTLQGAGTLQATGGTVTSQSIGMFVVGALTVSGGTLTAAAGAAQGSWGLYIGGNISVSGGAVSGTGTAATVSSYGVCTLSALTVSGSGEMTGTAGNGYSSWGVVSNGALTVSDSGKITGTGGTASGAPGTVTNVCTSLGVHAGNLLLVSGSGRITATGGAANGASGVSYGVHTEGAVTVSGGTLTARGGTVQGSLGVSYGAYTTGALTVSGGTLTATADAAQGSYGLYIGGDIGVSNGAVSGTGGGTASSSTGNSIGVYGLGALRVSGGTLTAAAGVATLGGSFGLYIVGATDVTDGTVSGTGSTAFATSLGVHVYGTLTVSDSGKLTGTGGNSYFSRGVTASADLELSDNGEITGTGGTVNGDPQSATYVCTSAGVTFNGASISGGTLTGKGGTALGENGSSYGVFTTHFVPNYSGGRLVAETVMSWDANQHALSVEPALNASYYWRTARADDYTPSGVQPYAWAASQTYVDIREGLPALPSITVSVPRFNEGQAPDNELITVEQDADFNATNNFLSASLGSATLNLGTVGHPGAHGSVEDGSILIRLNKTYLDTLTIGDYTLTVNLKGPGYTGRSVDADIHVDPALPPLPSITVSVPRFYEGQAPGNELITVEQGAGFDATNNFWMASLGSTMLDLGTVGHPGTHGFIDDGSILIRLYKSYLDTLTTGDYTLTVYLKGTGYLDRSVSANIRVDPAQASASPPEIPNTGDPSNAALWACVALLSAGALLTVNIARHRKKRKTENG